MSQHLELTVNDLLPSFKAKIPHVLKFFHFSRTAKEFHDAETIVFKQEGKPDYVIKDTFGKLAQ